MKIVDTEHAIYNLSLRFPYRFGDGGEEGRGEIDEKKIQGNSYFWMKITFPFLRKTPNLILFPRLGVVFELSKSLNKRDSLSSKFGTCVSKLHQ